MKLTKEENEMLDGKYGWPVQKSMELLVALGTLNDAERMVPIRSAHSTGQFNSIREAGVQFLEELGNKGGKFRVPVDVNPIGFDSDAPKDFGLSDHFVERQTASNAALAKMGAFLDFTCAPYLVGHVPRFGEHVAWNESSAVNLINSYLGARTNREGGPSSVAAALCGRTGEYGFHLDQNRWGDFKIVVTAKLKGIQDYGALGYFCGHISQVKTINPVFLGIPESISLDEFKNIGGGAQAGDVAIYHIVGITPEAPTEKAAFGGRKVKTSDTAEFGEKELRESKAALCTAKGQDVDIVGFGCPHCSITEFREIARLLSGKKVKSGVKLLITTARTTAAYARRTGDAAIIEAAGGRIMCDTCLPSKAGEIQKSLNRALIFASNHVKGTGATGGGRSNILNYYGTLETCIEAALTGKWRA